MSLLMMQLKIEIIWPPIENPVLFSSSVFKIIEASTMQKRRADKLSSCFTPRITSINLLVPISGLIADWDPSYWDARRVVISENI